MKRTGVALLTLAVCVWLANAPVLGAQAAPEDKPKAEVHGEKFTPLKVQVVWTDYDGDKKVKNLPYIFSVNAGSNNAYQFAKLRVGSKVPAHTGKGDEIQYIDVGTNIDCRALQADAGSFRLELVVERSWVEGEVAIGEIKEPIIRQFKTEMGVELRDGQSTESTVATDPISGRVSKIEITLSVLK
jgi:hypothetical protein